MALLSCSDAAFAYEGSMVVSKLSFQVETGDYLCIVGENGSGKSTLMKGLLGLKSASAGKITTGDGLKPNEIGYLPQQTVSQKDFPASVYEVVLSGRLNRRGILPFYSKMDKQEARKQIDRLGIAGIKNKCYRELSGGQQQRTLLARALCATEKLLLLDEPVAGLDPLATNELYRIIEQLNKEGITIVMVSHDIHMAIHYASHILHLQDNQGFFGTTKEYLQTSLGRRFLDICEKNTMLGKH